MTRRALLVLPTRSYRAAAFLAAARRQGIAVTVASEEASSLGPLVGERELVVDLGRLDEAAERAAAAHRRTPFDGVVGVDESAVLGAAHIAERLGLPHHPVAGVAATRDKRRLRTRLAAAGLPQPRFAISATDAGGAELEAAARSAGGFPVVAKPVDQAASRGVLRCDEPAALVEAVARIEAILTEACARPGPFPLLLEAYVPGAEVAVEGLVRAGAVAILAVFDKPEPLDGPTFAETSLVTPSRHPPAVSAAIAGLTAAAAGVLGLRDGPLHAELRLPLSGPVVVEVAARSIGGLCSRVLRFGEAGMSLEELILRHAVGLGPDPVERRGPASGVRMLPVPRAGRLRSVGGIEAAGAVAGVTGVELAVPMGASVRPLPAGDRYLGFVFATAPTPLEVEVALRDAARALRVVID